jgi:hypothetical protein
MIDSRTAFGVIEHSLEWNRTRLEDNIDRVLHITL